MDESSPSSKRRTQRQGEEANDSPSPAPEFPTAQVKRVAAWPERLIQAFGTKYWMLTLACIIAAVWITLAALGSAGDEITVTFQFGHGLKPGDPVRFRGIDIGKVKAVELASDLERVAVRLEIFHNAKDVAREGTRFWIERPKLSLSRVTGLETVVGAKYIGVEIDEREGKRKTVFEGLESPPTLAQTAPGEIVIRFSNGHGLTAGSPLKHRGITVGEVSDVSLDRKLSAVEVTVRLVESAKTLARAGSHFWIERPRVNVTGVGGLETLVAGPYISVLPGSSNSPALSKFEGLDQPPASMERVEGGLEIWLIARDRRGLQSGAPIYYRGIQIGHLLSVGISSDAVEIQARAVIRPEYRRLVRTKSVFWPISGLELDWGLMRGLTMNVESISDLTTGGVAMAIRDPPGGEVATGERFLLADKAPDDWRSWRPTIAVGSYSVEGELPRPRPLRASSQWKVRGFANFTKTRQIEAWVMVLENDQLLGPKDLFAILPQSESPLSPLTFALGGEEIEISAENVTILGQLALYTMPLPLVRTEAVASSPKWPRARMRLATGPEDCLIIGDPQTPAIPLASHRLQTQEDRPSNGDRPEAGEGVRAEPADGAAVTVDGGSEHAGTRWKIDPSFPLSDDLRGAAVVGRKDGALVGIIQIEKGQAFVALLTKRLAR